MAKIIRCYTAYMSISYFLIVREFQHFDGRNMKLRTKGPYYLKKSKFNKKRHKYSPTHHRSLETLGLEDRNFSWRDRCIMVSFTIGTGRRKRFCQIPMG